MASGDITYGTPVSYNNNDIGYSNFVKAIDSSHFLVVYRDAGNSDYGTAVIATITGAAINYGLEYVFNSSATLSNTVTMIDSTSFIISYGSGDGWAKVGTITSGNVISFGAATLFTDPATAGWNDLLDSTHFITVHTNGANNMAARVGTIASTTITFGTEVEFESGIGGYIVTKAIDSSHFVVAYTDPSNSYYPTVKIGTIASGVITYGLPYVYSSGAIAAQSIALIDSTHFTIAFRDSSNSSYGTSVIGVISNIDEVAFGLKYVFNSGLSSFITTVLMSPDLFEISYRDQGNGAFGTNVLGTMSDDTISFGSEYVFRSANIAENSSDRLSALTLVNSYLDYTDSQVYSSIGTVETNDVLVEIESITLDVISNAIPWFIVAEINSLSLDTITNTVGFTGDVSVYIESLTLDTTANQVSWPISFDINSLVLDVYALPQEVLVTNNLSLNTPLQNGTGIKYFPDMRRINENHFAWVGQSSTSSVAEVKIGEVDWLTDNTTLSAGVSGANSGSFSTPNIIPLDTHISISLFSSGNDTTNICQIVYTDVDAMTVSLDPIEYSFSSEILTQGLVWGVAISSTQFVIAYGNANSYLVVGTVENGVISFGPATQTYTVDGSMSINFDGTRIWLVKVFNNVDVYVTVHYVTANTITSGTSSTYISGQIDNFKRPIITNIGEGKILLTWATLGISWYGVVVEWFSDSSSLSNGGVSVILGEGVLDNGGNYLLDVGESIDDEVIVSYTASATNETKLVKMRIDGFSISLPYSDIVVDPGISYVAVCLLRDDLFELNYDSNYFVSGDTGNIWIQDKIVDVGPLLLDITTGVLSIRSDQHLDINSLLLDITPNYIDFSNIAVINSLTLDIISNDTSVIVTNRFFVDSLTLDVIPSLLEVRTEQRIDVNALVLDIISEPVDIYTRSVYSINSSTLDLISSGLEVRTEQRFDVNNLILDIISNDVSIRVKQFADINNLVLDLISVPVEIRLDTYFGRKSVGYSTMNATDISDSQLSVSDENDSNVHIDGENYSTLSTDDEKNSKIYIDAEDASSIL